MEEALLDVETFVLRQGIARAADARRREAAPQAESRQEVSAAAEAEAEAATERAVRCGVPSRVVFMGFDWLVAVALGAITRRRVLQRRITSTPFWMEAS